MNDYALIAEPDEARASIYAAIAAELGLLPVIIGDGERAAEMVTRRGAPRLAFVELALPSLNGFQLIERLRAVSSANDTRVIASSPFRELREAAREKPCSSRTSPCCSRPRSSRACAPVPAR